MKDREIETGCGTVLAIVGAVIAIVCTVALVLFLARMFGLWPDWAMEAELVFREAWRAWMR